MSAVDVSNRHMGGPTPPGSARTDISKSVSLPTKGNLPPLRTSETALEKTKQSDFIPNDVLFALTQPPPPQDQLGPPSRFRNLNTSTTTSRKAPAGVWHHQRRDKLKHLTDQTPCVCGAGQDISFLYDVPVSEKRLDKPPVQDDSYVRAVEKHSDERRQAMKLPDTLIPEEYHIVKNKGVMGLEYHDEKFTTQPQDHEKHLVVFPSMNPGSRYEVLQLKETLMEMLQKAGINDEEMEVKGLTQMHNLLELIKKEQNIYNMVFHELIRQVTVDCQERGELLANLRGRYNELLNKVPRQIKSLHEEVMAQRALDRRLTEELMRFKSTIGVLTSELTEVKQHDKRVTFEAQQAQEGLKSALAESRKNASLLAEYHDLYELQRKRLEKQVGMLAEEKEIWSTAAYSLALKVTEECQLNTAKRMHISEKSWAKLANHFTILLSDKDTELLAKLQGYVETWHDLMEQFNGSAISREDDMKQQVVKVRSGFEKWMQDFHHNVFTKTGQVANAPDATKIKEIYTDIKDWELTLSQQVEKFSGDTLLSSQDLLQNLRLQMHGWTECALKVFGRHHTDSGENYPDHEDMLKMNEEVELLLQQFYVRLTGENGTARGIIHLVNSLETWDNKLNAVMHGSNPLPDAEWLRFYQLLDDWVLSINDTLQYIGGTQKEDDREQGGMHRNVLVSDVFRWSQKWLSSATNGIDSEDAKLVEQVTTLHTEMVKWMVQMLLRLAPDRPDSSKEAKDAVLLGSAPLTKLQQNATSLFERLDHFTIYVSECCNGIVMTAMQMKIDAHEDGADHEFRDLKRMQTECDEWVHTAKMLLAELLGQPVPLPEHIKKKVVEEVKKPQPEITFVDKEKLITPGDEQENVPKTDGATEGGKDVDKDPAAPPTSTDEPAEPAKEPEQPTASNDSPEQVNTQPQEDTKLQVIGQDDNTHFKKLEEPTANQPPSQNIPQSSNIGERLPDTNKAYEALAAVDNLQDQLLATEERAQLAEDKSLRSEKELKDALEQVRALQRRLEKYETVEDETEEKTEDPKTETAKQATASPRATSKSPTPADRLTKTKSGTKKKKK
ncbi:unnamed protein product [Owenia fusiformis]|uniref:Uncharacterized protein n=1 Tax=Owenia fusiformis TaxID=6347 RepID=A0A8J1XTA9_OWEFU|nr:unnamed protein product [Owenia fusiformis]